MQALHKRIQRLDREAWLEERQRDHTIGGSDIAAILGTAPWRGPWDVWASKVCGHNEALTDERRAMFRRGHRWESMIIAEYEEQADDGREVEAATRGELFARHPVEAWAAASPDGLVTNPSRGDYQYQGGIECKTARDSREWGETGQVINCIDDGADRIIPRYYLTQTIWYLEATDLPWWDVAVAIPRPHDFPEHRVYRVMADRPTQERLLNFIGEWREKHLIGGAEPVPDATTGCRRQLIRQFRGSVEKRLRAADDLETELAYSLASMRQQQAALKLQITHAENRLAWRIKQAYGLQVANGARVLWTPQKGRDSVDMAKLREHFPEAAEACIKTGEPTRAFRLYGFGGDN